MSAANGVAPPAQDRRLWLRRLVRALPVVVASGVLVVGWAIVYHADIAQGQHWAQFNNSLGMAWYGLFSEGKLVERLQWMLLSVGLCAALWVWGQVIKHDGASPLRVPVFLLVAGLAVMLIEDALNFRHVVADQLLAPLHVDSVLPRMTRTAWEASFYVLLASVMVVPLIVLLRRGVLSAAAQVWALAAYGLYGLVAFGSALRRVGDWQERLGAWIIDRFELLDLQNWRLAQFSIDRWHAADESYTHTLGYLLVDHLVEESVELLAAALLVGAVIAVSDDVLARLRANRGKTSRRPA